METLRVGAVEGLFGFVGPHEPSDGDDVSMRCVADPFEGGFLRLIRSNREWVPVCAAVTGGGTVVGFVGMTSHVCIEWSVDEVGRYSGQQTYDLSRVRQWRSACTCQSWPECWHSTVAVLPPEIRDGVKARMLDFGVDSHDLGSAWELGLNDLDGNLTSPEVGVSLSKWLDFVDESPTAIAVVEAGLSLELRPDPTVVGPMVFQSYSPMARWHYRASSRPEAGHESEGNEEVELHIRTLSAGLDYLSTRSDYKALRTFWNRDFEISLASTLAELRSGRALSVSPLTGRLLSTDVSIPLGMPSIPWLSYCFMDGDDTYFELRAGGWCNTTKAVIFPRHGELHLSKAFDGWGDLTSPEILRDFSARWVAHFSSVNAETGRRVARPRVLLADSSNLGHNLWNVQSGLEILREMADSLGEGGVLELDSDIVLFQSGQDRPYVRSIFDQTALVDALAGWEISDLRAASNPLEPALHTIPLAGVMHQQVVHRILNLGGHSPLISYEPGGAQVSRHVLLSVRAHNKRCANIGQALASALEQGAKAGEEPVVVEIESVDPLSEEVSAITKLLTDSGVGVVVHPKLELPQLARLVSKSDVVIATVGSDLVIPTWICGTPTVVHGNRAHLGQLAWWGHVSERCDPRSLYVVDSSSTEQIEDRPYGDYLIAVDAFVTQFWRAMHRETSEAL